MGEKNAVVFYYIRAKALFNGYYICIWPRSVVHLSWIIYTEVVLPELFEEFHQSFSAQFFSVSNLLPSYVAN